MESLGDTKLIQQQLLDLHEKFMGRTIINQNGEIVYKLISFKLVKYYGLSKQFKHGQVFLTCEFDFKNQVSDVEIQKILKLGDDVLSAVQSLIYPFIYCIQVHPSASFAGNTFITGLKLTKVGKKVVSYIQKIEHQGGMFYVVSDNFAINLSVKMISYLSPGLQQVDGKFFKRNFIELIDTLNLR